MSSTASVTKGFIGVCTNQTQKECFDRMLFGSVTGWMDRVKQVKKGDTGFLLNLNSNMLFGIFKAESDGQKTIVKEAWNGGFPAQIRVSWEKRYDPIKNARILLKGLGIPLGRYTITTKETTVLRDLFENPDEQQIATMQPFLGKKIPPWLIIKADDGHRVRSLSEKAIDDWLYNQGLLHAYERRVPIQEEMYCDFYVKVAKCYIEYWGMEDDRQYLTRKQQKVDLYRKHELSLVELRYEDIQRLDDVLGKHLGKYLTS